MKNTVVAFIKILLISICLNSPLHAQYLQPTKKIPVIESRAPGATDYYVIFLTGNGGWRDLAQYVARYLNSKNVSVLAINTKLYLWSEKTPAQIACDLESLIDRYNLKWGQDKVVLLGYSMGAEVIPFAVNHLGDKYRSKIEDFVLIGPWQKATFEVRLVDYFFEVNKGEDIYSELLKMKMKRGYLICDDNKISICLKDLDGVIDHDFLGGGHHFGGDYATLSKLIGKRLNLE